MKLLAVISCFTASCLLVNLATAAESGTIELHSKAKIERTQVSYNCGSAGNLAVSYVNADPNFLALVPVPKQTQPLVFASVISGSGARYAAGKYVWWVKGSSASLYDTTLSDNAPPTMTCDAS
ncbi:MULTISPECIES: MliC family protein [unclassified Rhizobium]|uniref:MliC family protein n=1 Tax=unclassified Rhizobium TaxID=2613769 RepID=UPI001FD84363|nr:MULTISPECIES: MliC family protein [unclassified Rhizobium]